MRGVDFRAVLAGVTFGIIWASAFTSARIIVVAAPPLTALGLRFLISGLVGVLLALALGQSWRLSAKAWRLVVIFGICQNALYLGLNFVAMQSLEASLAAIVASTMPLLVALVLWLAFGERLPPLGTAGLVAGVIGVALIMGSRVQGGADLFGLALCAVGVVSLTVATLAVRGASSGGNYLMVVGLQMLVGSAALFPVALLTESWSVEWSWPFAWAFGYTVLFPGLVATVIWFWLVNRIGAVKAAVYHFLTPFFGVLIAAMVLGEQVEAADLIGVLVIAAGILAVQLSKQKPTQA